MPGAGMDLEAHLVPSALRQGGRVGPSREINLLILLSNVFSLS